MAMARVIALGRFATTTMTAPSPWLFKQREESSILAQELLFFSSLVSGSGDREPPTMSQRRKKKPVREHPSKRSQNRKAQQQNKKERKAHPKQEEPKKPRQDREEKGAPKAEQDGATKKLKNVGLVDMKGPMFAPLQRKLEDIPIVQLDIKKKELMERFHWATKRRHNRAKEISPGRFYNVPLTPHPNPSNPPCGYGPLSAYGHSYHRIELLDSIDGDGMLVQLLIRDYDLYLVAFRRFKPGKGWSGWYYFADLELPVYLAKDSVKLRIGGSHSDSHPIGGQKSFKLVFTELGAYPENLGKENFRVPALLAVFIFSEAFRDRWMHQELLTRIKYDIEPRPFGYYMLDGNTGLRKYVDHMIVWKRLHAWSKFCGQCIEAGTSKGGLFDEESEMKLKDYDAVYLLTCFEEIIGEERGLLLVLMRDSDYLIMTKDDLEKPGAGLDCPNPGFDNIAGKPLTFYDAYGCVVKELSLS